MLIGKKISVSDNGFLSFEEDIVFPEPDIRYLEDALNVLYGKPEPNENPPLYYIYRGVSQEADVDLFEEGQLRYDLQVIPPGLNEREFNKTLGHFHPSKPNSKETYTEYHEVLTGEALFLLQKNNRTGEAEEVRVVAAKKGDRVYIPSGFGHVIINPGDQVLVTGHLVNSIFEPLYQPFAEKQGAAYYYILTEHEKGDFVKNPHYSQSTGLEMVSAPNVSQPVELPEGKSLYQAFIDNPKLFAMLK